MQFARRAVMAFNLTIVLCTTAQAPASTSPVRHRHGQHYTVSELYSSRARHRAVTILQLKLLELHEEHLDRLRRVILRKLPIDTLLKAEQRRE